MRWDFAWMATTSSSMSSSSATISAAVATQKSNVSFVSRKARCTNWTDWGRYSGSRCRLPLNRLCSQPKIQTPRHQRLRRHQLSNSQQVPKKSKKSKKSKKLVHPLRLGSDRDQALEAVLGHAHHDQAQQIATWQEAKEVPMGRWKLKKSSLNLRWKWCTSRH